MDTDSILRWVNTAFNILEFIIVIWLVRDRRILVISLKHLSTAVYELSQQPKPPEPPKPITTIPITKGKRIK